MNIFVSYTHVDERYLERLHKHFAMLKREGDFFAWTDHDILAGVQIDNRIRKELKSSNVFLALISPDYLASNYCYEEEFKHALALFKEGQMRIIPVIVEPCDWHSSPFSEFKALPNDGKPVSEWTNSNNAFLDVVKGLRAVASAMAQENQDFTSNDIISQVTTASSARRPRLKQDFDYIQRSDFADKAFETIKSYFQSSCLEISGIDDSIKAKFENMGNSAFTCTVINRGKIGGGTAHITVHNSKTSHFGAMSFSYDSHGQGNTSNGGISVEADDYNMYLSLNAFSSSGREQKLTANQVAEKLWEDFVGHAGVDYE